MTNIFNEDEEFEMYFTDYFATRISGTNWQEAILTPSGIDFMMTDLVAMGDGLEKSLNQADVIAVASGTVETDTASLGGMLWNWNDSQDTIYSNYLYGRLIAVMINSEPTIKLKRWFPNMTKYEADVLWNLMNVYRSEDSNLANAYEKAIALADSGLLKYDGDNSLI